MFRILSVRLIHAMHALTSIVGITSKTPYVAIDEQGLVRSIHLFLFSCMHYLNSILWTKL